MSQLFKCHVGLSDHTKGIGVALASVALGAKVIEKHFTISRKDGGVDATFSLEPNEFKQLVSETYKAWLSLGKINYGVTEEETNSNNVRRNVEHSEALPLVSSSSSSLFSVALLISSTLAFVLL